MKTLISALLLIVLLTGCASKEANSEPPASVDKAPTATKKEVSTEAPEDSLALSVEGAKLVQGDGTPFQLRGLSSHGLSWFPQYVNKDMLMQMQKEWNCNVFRLAMYTAEYNGYCTGDEINRLALKELIDRAVTETEELGMYLIIDWHILSDNNPLIHQDEALAFFEEMSRKYADKSHLLYEICNEPNGDTSWEDIRAYASTIIPAIRAHTDSVILVGTPNWSQDIHLVAENPLADYDNIMYTLHFYAATHKEYLRTRMLDAVKGGLPIFVSEFGICDASGNGIIDEPQANLWLEAMNSQNISYVMWNLSNKDESSAVILPSCTKTTDFDSEDLSQSGLWFVGSADSPKKTASKADSKTETAPTGNAEKGLSCKAQPENNWESDNQFFQQYSLNIQNNDKNAVSTWKITLTFDQDIQLEDSWNGKFTVSGNTITITPVDYNKEVVTGQAITDIGFIVSGNGPFTLTKNTIN
ncbi:endoglucanase [Lachnospiraceae bacterium PFB1-21]